MLLASHLTEENHRVVLDAARYLSKRQAEELVARLDPQPPVLTSIRWLPMPRPSPATALSVAALNSKVQSEPNSDTSVSTSPVQPSVAAAVAVHPVPAPKHRAIIAPLAAERYRVQFTASAEMCEKLRRAQALLRHQIPDGDPAAIFDRALTVLLEVLAKQKAGATDHPRGGSGGRRQADISRSRHIPAEVRRAVWQRDGGQCAFVSPTGLRCTERGFLEFHHVVPFSAGGGSSIDNIQLRCRAHNGYEAGLTFGRGNTRVVRESDTNPPV